MTKLIKYELKSIILSKKYFYINLLLIISVLKDLNTLLGSWNLHAAVSPWTYADFIVRQNSLLITFIVLLGLNVFSNNENRVKNIMFSTTFSEKGYYFLKQIGIFISICISIIILIALSFIWYAYYLRFYDFNKFLYPTVILVFPALLLILGLSMNIGRASEKLLNLFIPIVFLGTSLNLNLPQWLDIAGNNTIRYLLFASNEDFILPLDFLFSRIFMTVLGMVLIIFACRKSKA
ncbi:hypothetical protein [Clostridium lundense]|uniref:hypothetical protein n=1 Tax=Clostridium lundense TaxID=319475 RepID=UPI000483589C|nr:hypothetical protein [Clostridium lundense]